MRALRLLALTALASFYVAAVSAQDLQAIPKLQARVTDLTGTLTAEQQAALEEKLAAFEARKGAQLAVLIVPSTEPEQIEQYAIRVVDAWKLGREAVDDGALLLIAKNDRELRIEVGYGLEGALPDATARRIIAETITPLFRQGDYYGGINAGLDQIIRVIDGEPLPPPDRKWQGGGAQNIAPMLPLLFMVAFIGSAILRAIFGRGLGAIFTGGVVGFIVWMVSQALIAALITGFIALLFALFSGIAGGGRWSSPPRHGGWGGGGFGGLGGRGGLGGGFGGMGGGFGGGGASGRW